MKTEPEEGQQYTALVRTVWDNVSVQVNAQMFNELRGTVYKRITEAVGGRVWGHIGYAIADRVVVRINERKLLNGTRKYLRIEEWE